MELNYAQKREIFEKGFVKIPGVVPRVMINAALRAINHSIGEGMNSADMATLRSQTYCAEIARTPIIADLMNKTPAWELAESVIGAGKIRPISGGQIGLRFPKMQDPPGQPRAHIDGMHTPDNGVPKGEISNFTCLIGMFLSDLPQPNSGNFTVWPGTHRTFEAYFREHTPQSLLEGMPKVEMPEPEQIIAQAGDIVLCHYQLAHSVAPNVSPHIRYGIFFRLSHIQHDAQKWDCMTNLWLEWEGMREFAPPK